MLGRISTLRTSAVGFIARDAFAAKGMLVRPQLAGSSRSMAIVPFKLADIGEGIAEVELMKWFVKAGDSVKSFDRICEVQSDKATVEITSRYAGKIAAVHHKEGEIVKVGAALVDIETADGPAAAAGAPAAKAASAPAPEAKKPLGFNDHNDGINAGKVLTTPAVRKIAKENKIDLSTLAGTGPKGRVLKEDVLNYIQNGGKPAAAAPAATSAPAAHATTSSTEHDVRVPIRGIQRLMVKSMKAAADVPHLTYCEEIIVDNLIATRHQLRDLAKERGVKLSYMPFIIKAAALAIKKYPIINSTVNADCTEFIMHHDVNMGVAMDTPRGLVVPVIKKVNEKSIFDIAAELSSLQHSASSGTLTEAQLQGGTFTLSNIGSIGGTYAVPVLVVPQVTIGALGRFQVVPRYEMPGTHAQPTSEEIYSGKAVVVPKTTMNVSWSADHRVLDGATVARFSNQWKMYMESPAVMLAKLK